MYRYVINNLKKGRLRLEKFGVYELGPWVIMDLEGVVLSAKTVHKDEDLFGQPIEHIAELINLVKSLGYKIALFTTRKVSEGAVKWMKAQGLDFNVVLSLPTKKYPTAGTLYLGDQVIGFDEDDILGSLAYVEHRLAQEQLHIHQVYGMTVNELRARRFKREKKNRLTVQLKSEIRPLVISGHAVVGGSGSKNSIIYGDF